MKFSISGEYITDRTRDLVLSGKWRKAIDFLKQSFNDIDYDSILNVMKGEKKFTGINDLDLIAESDNIKKEYQNEVNQVYSVGRIIFNEKRYVLYGYVDQVEDYYIDNSISDLRSGKSRYNNLKKEISTYYMKDKEDESFIVMLPQLKRNCTVLFEKDFGEDPPFWIEISKNVQEVVNEYGYINNLGKKVSFDDVLLEDIKFETIKLNDKNIIELDSVKNNSVLMSPPYPDITSSLTQQHIEYELNKLGYTPDSYTSELKEKINIELTKRNAVWDIFEYIDLETGYKNKISYPIKLALAYALSTTNANHLAEQWEPFSISGIKTSNDNPLHTDLWIAMGLPLDSSIYARNHVNFKMFEDLISHIQKKHLGYEIHILTAANTKVINGIFRTPENFDKRTEGEDTILILPYAGTEFQMMVLQSKAVITQVSGKLSHLVIVGREIGIPMVRYEEALEKCKDGMSGTVDLENGKIIIIPEYNYNIFNKINSEKRKLK